MTFYQLLALQIMAHLFADYFFQTGKHSIKGNL